MSRLLPWLWYPLLMGAAIGAFAALLAGGAHPFIAAHLPITVAALTLALLERRFPERLDWQPRRSDLRTDAAFIAFVQVAVPRALTALAVLALASLRHDTPSGPWPHHWPLAAQVLAMVLAVDLMRYLLHRACHHFKPLWRLHQVHHSPDILYTLNTARFHPLEKALHFAFDTLPFLLLGVAPEVIAGYFLVYAVNGFFQHSNLNLRYGWLNRVIGSAETHRWHHARDPKAAACNFGSTTLLWDHLFGTWSLPQHRPVGEIGLEDRHYPRGFVAQMTRPFRGTGGKLVDALLALRLRWTLWRESRRIAADARNPMHAQRALLADLLRRHRNTVFGREHNFAGIDDLEDFRRCVPVREHEALRPFIDAAIAGTPSALTRERPEVYLRTSGSTGRPKDIPLTAHHRAELQRLQRMSVAFQMRSCPDMFDGPILAVTGAAEEGRLANGQAFGSAAGVVAACTPAVMRRKFVVPQSVFGIADSRVKYLLILRLALARPDTTAFGTANPTTLLALIGLYREHEEALIADLRHGGFFLADQAPPEVMAELRDRLLPEPAIADSLQGLRNRGVKARLADLLPRLRAVVTWTCASAGIAVSALRRELASRTRILELGYLASEFRATVTLGLRAGSGWPTLRTHFFEFVERDAWDRGTPEFLTLDQLRKGPLYYPVVTTPSGLYRYFINDLVRVRGHLYRTPLLQFVQKGKGVTSITGEKLYETQVLSAVRAAMARTGRAVRFVMMLADEAAQRYRLYIEPDAGSRPSPRQLATEVDALLAGSNVEYRAKRESLRLGDIEAHWLRQGTGESYKQHRVQRGQREGQFKSPALVRAREIDFDLQSHVEAYA